MSYMDDTNAGVPHVVVAFLVQRLEELGPPDGIVLSMSKNVFITSTKGESPLPYLPRELKRHPPAH